MAIETSAILGNSGNPAFGSRELNEGEVVLLIDALDEVANEAKVKIVIGRIVEFSNDFPKCKVIITSRDCSILREKTILREFKTYTILPLGWNEAKKIVECASTAKDLPKNLKTEVLRQLEKVHGIELNPLLVTVFVATTDGTRRDIPANITEMFSKFVEMMLGRWDTKKGVQQQFEAPLKHMLIGRLALKMHSQKVISIPCDDCEKFIKLELMELTGEEPKIDRLLDEVLNRSGLFRVIDDRYEFRHLLIQEYFAGKALKTIDDIVPHCGDEWWRRAIIFYFGSNPDDAEGLLKIASESIQLDSQSEFIRAGTIGLSTQACYYVKMQDKADVLKWVIKTFSECRDVYGSLEDDSILEGLVNYYLAGRDSVASEVLKQTAQFESLFDEGDETESELCHFWTIVGLIESGSLKEAEDLLKKFRPKNSRLLLAIHLGVLMVASERVTKKENKEIAVRISTDLAPRIALHRRQLVKEFNSELLEVRKGQIEAIEIKGS